MIWINQKKHNPKRMLRLNMLRAERKFITFYWKYDYIIELAIVLSVFFFVFCIGLCCFA